MADWQPIETAPKGDGPMLLYCPEDNFIRRAIKIGEWTNIVSRHEPPRQAWLEAGHGHSFLGLRPTHWMPLPKPPPET